MNVSTDAQVVVPAFQLGSVQQDSTDETRVYAFKGKVLSRYDQTPVEGVLITVRSSDFEVAVTSAATGYYAVENIPEGTYEVEISKPGFTTKKIDALQIDSDLSTVLNILLEPRNPIVVPEEPQFETVWDLSGQVRVIFSAIVYDPDGFQDIKEVRLTHPSLMDAMIQGVQMTPVADDQMDEHKARFQYTSLIPTSRDPRHYSLVVRATDQMGLTGYGVIDVDMPQRVQTSLLYLQLLRNAVNNAVNLQTLTITVTVGKDLFTTIDTENLLSGKSLKTEGASVPPMLEFMKEKGEKNGEEGCYVEVKIYRPDMTLYGTYIVYDTMNITIPDARKQVNGPMRQSTTVPNPLDVEIENPREQYRHRDGHGPTVGYGQGDWRCGHILEYRRGNRFRDHRFLFGGCCRRSRGPCQFGIRLSDEHENGSECDIR